MSIKSLIKITHLVPRTIFVIDAFGATLSFFGIFLILTFFQHIFGIPREVLYFLAIFPCIFLLYDFICYFKVKKNLGIYLKIIGSLNILYCVLSIGLALYHHDTVTRFGWVYILLEIVILTPLIYLELKEANRLK